MDDSQYKNVMEELRGMREEVGRIDRDLARDRNDLADFRVQMEGMQSEIKQLRESLNANADRVKDKVTDAVQPIQTEVTKLKNVIKDKKTLFVFRNGFKDFFKIGWKPKKEEGVSK
jgi:predicted translin family RNA/ssDNA-binding protein